jgi:preprotein translocase subunit SecG
MSELTPEQLKRQMYFRLTIFFLICIVVGFIFSDLNINSQMNEKESEQTVNDMRR